MDRLLADFDIGEKFADLKRIGFGLDSAACGEHSDVAAAGYIADTFHSGADNAQHAACGVRCGRSFICMLRRALADAVLQARITRWHPISNSRVTACNVKA